MPQSLAFRYRICRYFFGNNDTANG